MTTDSLAPETRAAKGKKFYELWLSSGGTLPPGNYVPWDKLDKAVQGRWIWFSKMVPEPRHDHYQPEPLDALKYPAATRVGQSLNYEDWDEMFHPTDSLSARSERAAQEMFYELWVASRNATLRQHWWQRSRPIWVDTSRAAFDRLVAQRRQQAAEGKVVPTPGPFSPDLSLLDMVNASRGKRYER